MDVRSLFGWLRGRRTEAQRPAGPVRIDPATLEAVRARLRRRAIRMEIGGFRPPDGSGGSWFGRVNLALPGEGWPTSDGQPLHALAQIDLTQLPYRPPRLDDVAMVTVFIADPPPYEDEPNGDGWCLRAYPDLARLVPLDPVDTGSSLRPFPMRPEIVEDDYPGHDDMPGEIPGDVRDEFGETFRTAEGFKLGGWPLLVQSEIEWGAWGEHPGRPEYIFQIDSTGKGGWMWGDSGVGYFGRGTQPGHTDEWTLSWQCY
jgi:hypothetical protein